MKKNKNLIDQINKMANRKRSENIEKAANDILPQIYASLAIALHKTHGFGYVRINRIFVESQKIWTEFVGRGKEMIDLCEKETGIKVIYKDPEEQA